MIKSGVLGKVFYIKSSAAHDVSLLIRNDIKAVQTLKDQWVAETFQ